MSRRFGGERNTDPSVLRAMKALPRNGAGQQQLSVLALFMSEQLLDVFNCSARVYGQSDTDHDFTWLEKRRSPVLLRL